MPTYSTEQADLAVIIVEDGRWLQTLATNVDVESLLAKRPDAWEYLLFASFLRSRHGALDRKFRDFEARRAPPSGRWFNDAEAAPYLRSEFDEMGRIIGSLIRLFEPGILKAAFGPPGEPGNPERIRELADGWTSAYEGMMDWAARLRGATRTAMFQDLFETVARLIDQPVREYRAYVDALLRAIDDVPNKLASGMPVTINLTLTLGWDHSASADFERELARLTAVSRR